MRTGSRSDDDQLVRRLLAPPDLEDGVQSLGYWWGRSRRLPWYRLKARREAARMTARWEQRVRAALIAQRGVPAAIAGCRSGRCPDPAGTLDSKSQDRSAHDLRGRAHGLGHDPGHLPRGRGGVTAASRVIDRPRLVEEQHNASDELPSPKRCKSGSPGIDVGDSGSRVSFVCGLGGDWAAGSPTAPTPRPLRCLPLRCADPPQRGVSLGVD